MDRGELCGTLKRARALAAILLVVMTMATLGSCRQLFGSDTGPLEVAASGAEVTLAWDPASTSQISETPSAVNHYKIYYRAYGSQGWASLGATDGPVTRYTISQDDLDYGQWEFAVQSVRNDGRQSQMHSSSDFDAWPTGGWYLNWQPAD